MVLLELPTTTAMNDELDLKLGPKHVAIIMDGNRRWARKYDLSISEGHFKGAENLISICEEAPELGIEIITAYSFSTENWKRPSDEVAMLMQLFISFLDSQKEAMFSRGVCLHHIGEYNQLPKELQDKLQEVMEYTKNNSRLHLVLAINYGGRNEVVRAVKKIAASVNQGAISIEDITESSLDQCFDMPSFRDPDLLIRTSGEYRISNFLLWQLSYSEMYFTELYWPEFTTKELYNAVIVFQKRQRRLGGGE